MRKKLTSVGGGAVSVKAFATRCEAELDRLDILVNNAGMGSIKFNKTMDGHEEMMQVNVLSTGLLTVLLLPLIANSAATPVGEGSHDVSPHITLISSASKHPTSQTCSSLQS